MEITAKTKVNDLLNEYPALESYLMQLNDKYKKLKNPILRRTIGKLATLTQVAKIGGYETMDLVNKLRAEVGQSILGKDNNNASDEEKKSEQKPAWAMQEPKNIMDVGAVLANDKNPLAEASKLIKSLQDGEMILLKSDFLPSPLIDTFKEQGHKVYSEEINDKEFLTYITI